MDKTFKHSGRIQSERVSFPKDNITETGAAALASETSRPVTIYHTIHKPQIV